MSTGDIKTDMLAHVCTQVMCSHPLQVRHQKYVVVCSEQVKEKERAKGVFY